MSALVALFSHSVNLLLRLMHFSSSSLPPSSSPLQSHPTPGCTSSSSLPSCSTSSPPARPPSNNPSPPSFSHVKTHGAEIQATSDGCTLADNGSSSLASTASLDVLALEGASDLEAGRIGLARGKDDTVSGGVGRDVDRAVVGESGELERVDVLRAPLGSVGISLRGIGGGTHAEVSLLGGEDAEGSRAGVGERVALLDQEPLEVCNPIISSSPPLSSCRPRTYQPMRCFPEPFE